MDLDAPTADSDIVDVLTIGAGPAGAVVADEMARAGFSVVCLEQGRWVNNNEFPGDQQEWELLSQQRWSHDPNIRATKEDYPLAATDSDLHPVMIGSVGGSSLFYGRLRMRLLPSDFRMYSLDEGGDDWPLTYHDLAAYYDTIDATLALSGVEDDPKTLHILADTPDLPTALGGCMATTDSPSTFWPPSSRAPTTWFPGFVNVSDAQASSARRRPSTWPPMNSPTRSSRAR